ncbi:MAG: PIN domain nuclease [Candidatus Pacebacteria bacterium CG_4_10_14_0_8_um_filter_42_14]|nr:MAG: PIN domain nuclease [Candidatus Pacebacteria bacterium CG_4_10_14_0_8_um_filter_42_14]
MKSYLLDTHSFLWWITEDARMKDKTRKLLAGGHNLIYVSLCSAWEIVLKQEKRQDFVVRVPVEEIFSESQFKILPISLEHIAGLSKLPKIHKDPFDRLLASQAIVEDLILVTNDEKLHKYPIKIIAC